METATIIAAIAGLILSIYLILIIYGNLIKTFVSYLKLTKEAYEYKKVIAIATGNQLNQWAYLHGLERNENETDEELRIRILSVRKKWKKTKKYFEKTIDNSK